MSCIGIYILPSSNTIVNLTKAIGCFNPPAEGVITNVELVLANVKGVRIEYFLSPLNRLLFSVPQGKL